MYKNLNATVLGVSGRQSELIELAMTYGFRGLDIDIVDLVKRTQRSEFEKAARYLLSAKMLVSGFETPIDLDSDDATFEKTLALLPATIEIAGKVNARAGFLRLPAATDRLPFHEYFDVLRKRVDRIAEIFAANKVMLGLYFSTAIENRENRQFKFIQDVDGFLAFFHACTNESVGLVIDTFNWIVGGGNLDHLTSLTVEKILCVRLASSPEEFDISSASIDQRMMPTKDGLVDNSAIAKKLYAEGYRSSVTAFPSPAALGGKTRDAALANVVESLDEIFASADIPIAGRKLEAQPMMAGR